MASLRAFFQSSMPVQLIELGVEPVVDHHESCRVYGFRYQGQLVVEFESEGHMASWIDGHANSSHLAESVKLAADAAKKEAAEAAKKEAESLKSRELEGQGQK